MGQRDALGLLRKLTQDNSGEARPNKNIWNSLQKIKDSKLKKWLRIEAAMARQNRSLLHFGNHEIN